MKFTLIIDCNTDAFGASESERNMEVHSILKKLAGEVLRGEVDLGAHFVRSQYRTIFDANGNDVGRVSYVREDIL